MKLTAALMFVLCAGGIAAQGTANGSIAGTVMASDVSRPAEGAVAYLDGARLTVRSDASGRFVIDNVAPGAHTIERGLPPRGAARSSSSRL